MPALYLDEVQGFLVIDAEQLLGRLTNGLAKQGFDTTTSTTFSWLREISEIQEAIERVAIRLPEAARWSILLEYVLPIVVRG